MIAAERLLGDRSLKLEVYAAIVAQIHRGELRPGDRVGEADVASGSASAGPPSVKPSHSSPTKA